MASQILILTFFIILTQPTESVENEPMPVFAFGWLDDKDTFMAGDIATIKVIVLGNYEPIKHEFPFNPNITVNDKIGNSSFITGVSLDFNGPTDNWRIRFNPIMIGSFHVLIEDEHFHVLDSSLQFRVNSGRMYPAAGILSWADGINEFMAGTPAEILILPKDAFGNNVSSASEGSSIHNYTLLVSTSEVSLPILINITEKRWDQKGYLSIKFITATAGDLLLHVEVENQTLHQSPFPFLVIPGNLDVHSCIARLNVETKYFQLFSTMEGSIHRQDRFGNVISELYAFDIEVIEIPTNLSMPVADLLLKDIGIGIQSFSFGLHEPGNFTLVISDKEDKIIPISDLPYDFTVYIGYCDGVKSVVNGSGLNKSVAGEIAKFSIFLKDAYLYPSPVELESVQVRISRESDSQVIHPSIYIKENANGSFGSGNLNYGVINALQSASAPVIDPKSNATESRSHKASDFDVFYIPEKSGFYEIRVFCGNIPLNDGKPSRMEVTPGVVNISLSGVVKFSEKVPKLVKNEIIVRLVDSYNNPVLLQESKLKLEIASINKSASKTWMFSDNKDGSYSANYLVQDIGTYEICASYNGEHFVPCPFGVKVYNNEYFPKAYNDTVLVWEDESIGFNVLENDYFAGGTASILEYSKPSHGSIVQYWSLFRYTPYRGLYGNDSFSYTISDINGNLAFADVDLLILCRPPQFVSIPSNLQATEDIVSPTFGGFLGFEITYSDLDENISVTLSSISGNVLLSPTQMQFWQPRWDELAVHKGVKMPFEITLFASLDAINFVLQSIQYFGNENFYGGDTIRVSTINKNGKNDINVPIYVQPINDPPIINIPSFVILDEIRDGILIFGDHTKKLDYIIDPDLQDFPFSNSRFVMMLSIEVSVGLISTSLPAELIGSTEIKTRSSYQWQPLQTFVTISKHFLVKAKGIRFRGSIDVCNAILDQLSYHEGKHGAVLSLSVNDLGNYGCYPSCDEMMSVNLFAEVTVNLVKNRPMSTLAAHTLGSAIVIESIVIFCLGSLMLFFVCKCARVLVNEKKRQRAAEMELSHSHRSLHMSATEEDDRIMRDSPQSSGDRNKDTPASDVVPSVIVE